MHVRSAVVEDRTDVLAIAERLVAFGPTTRTAAEIVAGERRALDAALRGVSPGSELFVADDEHGGVLGVLLMETRTDYFTQESHAHVSILAVAQGAEGGGIGSALLDRAETWARAHGFRRLTLAVFTNNERAKTLYARRGWQPELETYFKTLSDRQE
jgi:GNAT superfamily N-acetyltransferase